MVTTAYDPHKRWVGIDLWRGVVILVALIIHLTDVRPISWMFTFGDFFSGYATIGVVFAGIAGMMGHMAYGRKPRSLKVIIKREWIRAGKLLATYAGCFWLLKALHLGGIQWLSIYPTLAAVYLSAPLFWWLIMKINRAYGSGWLAAGLSLLAVGLIHTTNLESSLRLWLIDYRLNTTPLLLMLATYFVGAMIMELNLKGQLKRANFILAWIAIGVYAVGRYWLNAHDIYPNNQWFIRLGLFAVLAVGFLGLRLKHWPRSILVLAYIGQQSFAVFTIGNLLLALLL